MARKNKFKGAGRRYSRKAFSYARRGGNRVMNMAGIGKGGLKVGKFITFMSLILGPFMPCWRRASDGKWLGPITIVMEGASPTQPLFERMMDGLRLAGYNYLGWAGGLDMTTPNTWNQTYKGLAGKGIVIGAGITIAGKFVNPFIGGSVVKA